jgi:hypothetical protein
MAIAGAGLRHGKASFAKRQVANESCSMNPFRGWHGIASQPHSFENKSKRYIVNDKQVNKYVNEFKKLSSV